MSDLERRVAYLERLLAELERRITELERQNAGNQTVAWGST